MGHIASSLNKINVVFDYRNFDYKVNCDCVLILIVKFDLYKFNKWFAKVLSFKF